MGKYCSFGAALAGRATVAASPIAIPASERLIINRTFIVHSS
jgi:hypothetical protein